MAQASDVWLAAFIAATERYGEDRAPQVADRAVEAFKERFGPLEVSAVVDGPKLAAAIAPQVKSEEVKK